MAAPIVTYWNAEGTEAVSEWNIGEIDAGSDSAEKVITVWNNKNGDEAVSHMKNVTVSVVNEKGTTSGSDYGSDVVLNQAWIRVEVNPNLSQAFAGTPIGSGDNYVHVTAKGLDEDNPEEKWMIKGDANDGTVNNAVSNYAVYRLRVSVPPNAPEGDKPCRIRTSYSYT